MRDLGRGLLCLVLLLFCGCGTKSPVTELIPRNDQGWLEQDLEFRQGVDLLLVLDDGPSMKPKQAAFERGFHALLELFFSPWNNVDLQVAQVSTRAGVRERPGQPCLTRPLQLSVLNTPSSNPLDWSCESTQESGLAGRHRVGPGAVRTCLSSLGHRGCGRNAALEHMQEALSTGLKRWVRDDAVLALVFLSDERDCSLGDTAALGSDKFNGTIGAEELSERCFNLGAHCQGEEAGAYAQCEVRENEKGLDGDLQLLSSQKVVDELFALKGNRYDQVIALAISGVSDQEESQVGYPLPKEEDKRAPGLGCVQWSLAHASLRSQERVHKDDAALLGAQAPIRLRAVAEQTTTPQERAIYSICVDDLRRSLHEIATQILSRVRPACVFGELLERPSEGDSSAPYCEVIEHGTQGARVVPECERGSDGAYLLDEQGQGLARPDGAPRCVSYKTDALGGQSLDPYDDMSEQCRAQKAALEVKMHGAVVPMSKKDVHWTLRCARASF